MITLSGLAGLLSCIGIPADGQRQSPADEQYTTNLFLPTKNKLVVNGK